MAYRYLTSNRLGGIGRPALRPAATGHQPLAFLAPAIYAASGCVPSAVSASHTATLFTRADDMKVKAKYRTFNARKNILTNYNNAQNAKRRLEIKWDLEKKDDSANTDLPIGKQLRKLKKLAKIERRLTHEARSAGKAAGKEYEPTPFSPERSFRQRTRNLTDEFKRHNDRIKTIPRDERRDLIASLEAKLRKEMKLLRVLLRGRDPKFDDYDQACINTSRIRAPWVTLIIMSSRTGEFETALRLFNDMKKVGIAPGASAYTALFNGLVSKELSSAAAKAQSDPVKPPFKAVGKSIARADMLFAELEVLWRAAFPDHYPPHPVPVKRPQTKDDMMREMRKHSGSDTTRLRILSKQGVILEIREHPNLLVMAANVYLRILLIAGRREEAWRLFDIICSVGKTPRKTHTDRMYSVEPIADRVTFTEMLSGIPKVHNNEGESGEAAAEGYERFRQVETIWERWEAAIDRTLAKSERSPHNRTVGQRASLREEQQLPSDADKTSTPSTSSAVDSLLVEEDGLTTTEASASRSAASTSPLSSSASSPAHDSAEDDTLEREHARIFPEERAIVLLFNKLIRTQPKEQKLMKRVMLKCFGITSNDDSGLLQLDSEARDIALLPSASAPPPQPVTELTDPHLVETVLRAFAYPSTWKTGIDYFNQILALSLPRRIENGWPMGPLLPTRNVMSAIITLGFAPDPMGVVLLLRLGRRPPHNLHTDETYARALRTISFGSMEGAEVGGLSRLAIERSSSDGSARPYDPWLLAEETFRLCVADRKVRETDSHPHSSAGGDADPHSPLWYDLTSQILQRLLMTCNRPSKQSHQAARTRKCLDMIHAYLPLPQIVELYHPKPSSSSPTPEPKGTDSKTTTKMLEELHVALSNAIMPNYVDGEQRPSEAKLSMWKDCRADVARFKPDREKRYEEKRWLQQGVGASAAEQKGVTLKLTNEDFKNLKEEPREDDEFDDEDQSGTARRKTRRGMAMDKELERWVRG